MSLSVLKRYARPAAVIVLLLVTAVGGYAFFSGDWTDVVDYWGQHLEIIPVLVLFSILDVTLESLAWMWSYALLKIRAFDRQGVIVYLAGRAGLLMPAQLGRLIRPDAMVRLGRASMIECLKAESVMFVLDGVSVLALLAGLIVFKTYPLMALPVAAAIVIVMIWSGDKLADLLAHTHFSFEKGTWRSWSAIGVVLVQMAGWIMHGLALFVVVAGLPGAMTLWDALFFGPGSAVLGTGTGLPGGIGATEGLLGASMRFREVPAEHLAIAVAAFRLITFWAWIPVGWFALIALRGRQEAVRQLKEH
jgi:uncharacterized membrane protein YbhN (UPF0104 family)